QSSPKCAMQVWFPSPIVVWNAAREGSPRIARPQPSQPREPRAARASLMRRPEILAPCGDRDALAAALAGGADAVYLGLDDGFNARARATNFPSRELSDVVRLVRRAGARLYVTLNTLVFEPELGIVEELVRRCAGAGVDALIVQDP